MEDTVLITREEVEAIKRLRPLLLVRTWGDKLALDVLDGALTRIDEELTATDKAPDGWNGLDEKVIQLLIDNGFSDLASAGAADDQALLDIKGIGPKSLAEIRVAQGV